MNVINSFSPSIAS